MPSSARTFSLLPASNATRCRSTPFGITVSFLALMPQPVIRSRTAADTAMVMSENSSVPRYRACTGRVILRRSRWVSPMECSVLSTTGVPASQAAGRP